MSDDPIAIDAKLDDKKDYSLAPFIDYFIERGFHVSAHRLKKEDLSKSLQSKLVEGKNFFYTSEMSGMFNEQFFLSNRTYEFNIDNYKNVYLPNKNNIVLDVYPDEGNRQAYSEIEITDPNNKSYSYEFRVGLVDTFLFGRLLIITVYYLSSKKIMQCLGYDEDQTDDIALVLYPIISKNYHPRKIHYVGLSGYREDFYEFFSEDDKYIFKQKVIARTEEDVFFTLDLYNKKWSYKDYVNAGLINKYFVIQSNEILLYEKYADNFNCPKPILDKAWEWYEESGYTFMDD